MSDIDISPLAKRLADENNVDWRILRGTGEAGRVVERDVLDYLARVMAGEEDLDPTPEPLPSGMESWTDQDATTAKDSSWGKSEASGAADGADTFWADPDEDLLDLDDAPDSSGAGGTGDSGRAAEASEPESGWYTDSDRSTSESDAGAAESDAGPSFGLEAEAAVHGDLEIDEDIFLFDDEPATGHAAAESADSTDSTDSESSWADDVAGFGERSEPDRDSGFGDDDFFSLKSDELTDPSAGDGREFSWNEPEPTEPTEPTEPAEPEVNSATPWEASLDEAAPASFADDEDTPWGDAEPLTETEAAESDVHADSAEDGYADEAATPWDAEPVVRDEAETAETAEALEAAGPEAADDLERQPAAGLVLEEAETRVADSVVEAAEASGAEAVMSAATPARSQPLPTRPLPFMKGRGFSGNGMVLRRDVDLTALHHAQQAVTQELGLTGIVSPASFLLRAAAKAGRPWPLISADDVPALVELSDDGVRLTNFPTAAKMPFRELVGACNDAAGEAEAESSALLVADLSVFGIDEAVLDLGRPVLTLGRILPDTGTERFRGTLALSGPVAPDAGSRFLARVVELLAAPVRLVL